MGEHVFPVKQHADGDEEQPQQQVVKRADFSFHLLLERCFRYQHASDEGAQGQAQTGALGQPRKPQSNEQQVEHEEFIAAQAGYYPEPVFHDVLAPRQQHPNDRRRLEHGQHHRGGHVAAWSGQGWNQDQQGHNR